MGLKLRNFFTGLRNREERPSRMALTVTEDTPADMLAGSMELLVQLPREHHQQTQRVTVQRSTPMMDLLVQITTAHKLAASSYTLQAIGERGMVLPHQPNTPIGALDALQVKLLPKQGTLVPRKIKQANQPFETTFRLQVHLPRNQLYVGRVSPRMNLGEILDKVCREKTLDKSKYELRHPVNLETLDLSLSLQDYHLQEVTLYAKQGRTLGSALSTQDIMALHRQEERRRQQAKQGVFGFVFKKSKECSLSTDSLGGRSASPARSDETGRSTSPLQPPTRPQRKRRPAPKPPVQAQPEVNNGPEENAGDSCKDKVVISHSRNSSDSSGYHEASVLSDNPDSAGRLPETLPRRSKFPSETPRKLAHTSQSSKSLSNLASVPGTLSRGISSTSLSSTGLRKKRNAPLPPVTRPLSSAISIQALERIVDSEESLTSDMDPSKPPSDIGAPSKANSDIEERPKASSDIGVTNTGAKIDFAKTGSLTVDVETKSEKVDTDESRHRSGSVNVKLPTDEEHTVPVEDPPVDVRVPRSRVGEPAPLPKPRKTSTSSNASIRPQVPKRKLAPPSPLSRTLSWTSSNVDHLTNGPPAHSASKNISKTPADDHAIRSSESSTVSDENIQNREKLDSTNEDDVFPAPRIERNQGSFDDVSVSTEENSRSKERKKQNLPVMQHEQRSPIIKRATGQEKKLCAVISTMPKCEHLAELAENKENLLFKKEHAESRSNINDTNDENRSGEGAKELRRPRIPRTASKSNDFETNSLEKQKRHFTSNSEDITFALNLNVTSNIASLSARSDQIGGNVTEQPRIEQYSAGIHGEGEGESSCGLGISDYNPSETDILLQKVSDTLSNSLPASNLSNAPVKRFVSPVETKSRTTNVSATTAPSNIKKTLNEDDLKRQSNDFPDGTTVDTSTPNLTVNSQQDTSDYVSAVDEDLSIADWEYQLPAPPSAFRDSASPVFDNFSEVISSPESFRDSELKENVKVLDGREQKAKRETESKFVLHKEDKKDTKQEKFYTQPKSDSNLKKIMITELENKIGTLPQSTKDFESKKVADNSSAPKIAPIDNTLSNFTITTYTRQKSLHTFEEVENQSRDKNTDDRFIKSFATLSRTRSNLVDADGRALKEFNVGGRLQAKMAADDAGDGKLEPKTHTESLHRQSSNEKTNIHRSKSYVSVCDKSKFQETTCEDEDPRKNRNAAETGDAGMKKATSISNVNATRTNEKFSQWRDNILKRQEEPTTEKQLQSLQVLKSILPQLKNAQQSEENVPKESDDTVLPVKTRSETTSKEHSIDSNVVSTYTDKKPEAEAKKIPPATSTKRYTYSGPPAISLGSWSERPSVNVHSKKDTDYKLDGHKVNNKTIVNINGIKDEKNGSIDFDDAMKPHKILQKGFKKPTLNKVHVESQPVNDKPVVTGVELKKSLPEAKPGDIMIDTAPVNFSELFKAFGQDIRPQPKPKRSTLNRRSDIQIEITSNKHNEHVNSEEINNERSVNCGSGNTLKSERSTNTVGVHSQNQGTFPFRNGISIKGSQPVPAIKSFKTSSATGEQCDQNNIKEAKKEPYKELSVSQPPRPPTMPVITGVTLKTARPKSMPVQVDTRDMLLESIRNFGGRENLKSAAERC